MCNLHSSESAPFKASNGIMIAAIMIAAKKFWFCWTPLQPLDTPDDSTFLSNIHELLDISGTGWPCGEPQGSVSGPIMFSLHLVLSFQKRLLVTSLLF